MVWHLSGANASRWCAVTCRKPSTGLNFSSWHSNFFHCFCASMVSISERSHWTKPWLRVRRSLLVENPNEKAFGFASLHFRLVCRLFRLCQDPACAVCDGSDCAFHYLNIVHRPCSCPIACATAIFSSYAVIRESLAARRREGPRGAKNAETSKSAPERVDDAQNRDREGKSVRFEDAPNESDSSQVDYGLLSV